MSSIYVCKFIAVLSQTVANSHMNTDTNVYYVALCIMCKCVFWGFGPKSHIMGLGVGRTAKYPA